MEVLKGKVAYLELPSLSEGETKALKVRSSSPVVISTSYNTYFPITPPLDRKGSSSLLPCPITVQDAQFSDQVGRKKTHDPYKNISLYCEVGQLILYLIFWLENEVHSALSLLEKKRGEKVLYLI